MGVKVITTSFEVETKKEGEVVEVTDRVAGAVKDSGFSQGLVTIFVTGSTAALTTIEFEPGLVKDFSRTMDRAAPKGIAYDHNRKWHDANGHSHIKASLLGPSLSVPFVDGELVLGQWQQVVLAEFDVRPRTRKVVLQVAGE